MILMGRTPHIDNFKFPSKHDFEVAQNSAKEIGITHLQNKYFTHLSGGEKISINFNDFSTRNRIYNFR